MTATPSSVPGDPRSRRPTGGASPQQEGRRRPVMRWTVRGVLFVALAVGVFGLLPRPCLIMMSYTTPVRHPL